VETCFPIEDPALKKRILRECRLYLTDNSQSWALTETGKYEKVETPSGKRCCAQETLLSELSGD
jgi:polyphosphate kinase